jgi:addiction module RelE/StbE family toxin
MRKAYLTEQAQKDLKEIPDHNRLRIQKKLNAFINKSVEGKQLTGRLKGFYSIKVWPYRIIYFFTKGEIWIVHIKHRREVYRRI